MSSSDVRSEPSSGTGGVDWHVTRRLAEGVGEEGRNSGTTYGVQPSEKIKDFRPVRSKYVLGLYDGGRVGESPSRTVNEGGGLGSGLVVKNDEVDVKKRTPKSFCRTRGRSVQEPWTLGKLNGPGDRVSKESWSLELRTWSVINRVYGGEGPSEGPELL